MVYDFLARVNPVDVLAACILLACLYSGVVHGAVFGIFKVLDSLVATFVILHYFVRIAGIIEVLFPVAFPAFEIVAYVFLWLTVTVLFNIVRIGWAASLKTGTISRVSRLLGFVLGLARAVLVGGLLILLFYISGNRLLVNKTRASLAGLYLKQVSLDIYNAVFDNIIVTIFPDEKKNEKVFKQIEKVLSSS